MSEAALGPARDQDDSESSGMSPEEVTLDVAGADEFSPACQSLPRTDPLGAQNVLAYITEFGRQLEASSHVRGDQDASIHDALVDLLGKPINESTALSPPRCTGTPGSVGQRRGVHQWLRGQLPVCGWAGSPQVLGDAPQHR